MAMRIFTVVIGRFHSFWLEDWIRSLFSQTLEDDYEEGSLSIGSLSNSVFERRTSTGSGRFASLGDGLVETL